MDEGGVCNDINEFKDEEPAKQELDPDNPDHAFAIIERDFTKTVAELEQNPELAGYADEFGRIFDAYYKSRESEGQLMETVDSLQIRIDQQSEQIGASQKLATVDLETINKMKDEMQHTWKMIDNAHAREQAAQEIIDNLSRQIVALNAEIDFKNKMTAQLEQDEELSKHKDTLQREKEKLISEVTKLTEKLNNSLNYQEELERRTSKTDMKIVEVSNQLEDTVQEIEHAMKSKDRCEREIINLKGTITEKELQIEERIESIEYLRKVIIKQENMYKEQKSATDTCMKESETINTKYAKLQDEFDVLNYKTEMVKTELNKVTHELKMKHDECYKLYNEIEKVVKFKEIAEKKLVVLEREISDANHERIKFKTDVITREKEIDDLKKLVDANKRSYEKIDREKEILNKNFIRQQAVSRDHTKLIKIQELAKRKLLLEIDSYTIEGNKKNKQIAYLEKERDRLLEEELELTKKIEDGLDEIKLKKVEVYDLKKNITTNETKLRMQQNLFDGIRAERNALQKALQESSSESTELKVKLKVTTHQTEQLKEDIAMKEQLLIKEEIILRKVTKEKENLRVNLNNALDVIRSLKQEIAEMTSEEKRLHQVITHDEKVIKQQTKELEQLMNERDIMGSQLVRRNDELTLLYEKIKILQTTLNRGEANYDQRLEDIRLLKLEIKRLRQQKNLLTKSISNMTDLRQEIFHLERDLTRERLKSRALEEDLQNPMNVHRWRKLEGSDPEILELLKKVQILQKRILAQSSEAAERERQLKESGVLYSNLRQVVAKQPGPESQKMLNNTQRSLTQHINKLKCITSELNMTELKALEYKVELDNVTEELNALKRKYSHLQKRIQNKDSKMNEPSEAGECVGGSRTKMAGGGFKLSVGSMPEKNIDHK